jgi:hypothetical protein
MAIRAGRDGRIYIDTSSGGSGAAVPVVSKNHWSLSQSTDKQEVTCFGDTTKVYVQSLPDASGAFEGYWDDADTSMYNLISSSAPRKFYVYPDRANAVTSYFFGTAYFDLSHDGTVGGQVTMTGSWSAATPVVWVHP